MMADETACVIVSKVIGRAIRAGFRLVEERPDGAQFVHADFNLIVSACTEQDGRVWVHLSLSLSRTMGKVSLSLPSWQQLVWAKEAVLGKEAKAIMIIAPRSEWVNIADVHHIWWCPEGEGLPDFTRGSGSL